MVLQPIVDLIELLALKGLTHVVISPGSRNAPLSLAFARNTNIRHLVVPDERSAAFIAVGMADQLGRPVALVCTSGSAAYNYAPAVAEAYFRQIPLLILTADRPEEWIDQLDGQTIRQNGLFGKHVKRSVQLPSSFDHSDIEWHINRLGNEVYNEADSYPKGPIHLNCPFREPFYPAGDEKFNPSGSIRVIHQERAQPTLTESIWPELKSSLEQKKKIVIVAGQGKLNPPLSEHLALLASKIVLISDVVSNIHEVPHGIQHHDLFLGQLNNSVKRQLQPDLLITYGLSVVSKNLKMFLRKFQPQEHWHIQPGGIPPDTFQSLTRIIPTEPLLFFEAEPFKDYSANKDYWRSWQNINTRTAEILTHNGFFSREMDLVQFVLNTLPNPTVLHLANSMPVRWANFFGLKNEQSNVEVFCNRGTSGIDGSNSTCVGSAVVNSSLHVLLTGDLAFHYDKNAFWNSSLPENLCIIILNNGGGGIFRLIQGPDAQDELASVFESEIQSTAENVSKDHGFTYQRIDPDNDYRQVIINAINSPKGRSIIEIFTSKEENKVAFDNLKTELRRLWN